VVGIKELGLFIRNSDKPLTEKHLMEYTKQTFNRSLTLQDVASLAGAIPGDEMDSVVLDETDGIIAVHTRRVVDGLTVMAADREINLRGYEITNLNMTVIRQADRGKGLATKMLLTQTRAAAQFGFDRINTHAAGEGNGTTEPQPEYASVGYYTWARLGFTSEDPVFATQVTGETEVSLPKLMSTKKGRDFWKAHGGSFDGFFDLEEGSVSRRVLEGYAKEKGL
jgi:hypothetical protein